MSTYDFSIKDLNCGHVRKVFALSIIFLIIYKSIRFKNMYRQNEGFPMGTYCAPLVADLFLFCYERLQVVSF